MNSRSFAVQYWIWGQADYRVAELLVVRFSLRRSRFDVQSLDSSPVSSVVILFLFDADTDSDTDPDLEEKPET